jgi:hypothetical protein
MKHRIPALTLLGLIAFIAGVLSAQQTSTQEKIKGESNTQVMVRSGTVLAVDGNNLIVKMQDGEVKHFTVPEDSKFTVDGKEVGISELKPGTELTQSIMTTRTPTVVRTTTTIKGRVFSVNPPTSVILTLGDGTNKRYYIPEGQKINVDGQELDAFSLKPGMKINAKVTQEVPAEDVEVRRGSVAGVAPEPAPAEQPTTTAQNTHQAPVAAAPAAAPESTPAPTEKQTLPQTASPLPIVGLLGGALIVAGWAMKRRRSK